MLTDTNVNRLANAIEHAANVLAVAWVTVAVLGVVQWLVLRSPTLWRHGCA